MKLVRCCDLAFAFSVGAVAASTVLFIAGFMFPADFDTFALAKPLVGLVFAGGLLLLIKFQPEALGKPVGQHASVGLVFAFGTCVWNTVAAIVLTTDKPYTITCNGYFASWATVGFSVAIFSELSQRRVVESARSAVGRLLSIIIACAVVLMIACAARLETGGGVFGLIVAVLTLGYGAGLILLGDQLYDAAGGRLVLVLNGVLFLLWAIAAPFLTFDGPFIFTGNG